jgi:hypothetical protein
VLYDADLIANLEEKQDKKPMDPKRFADIIKRSFLTNGGREEAKKVLGIKREENS